MIVVGAPAPPRPRTEPTVAATVLVVFVGELDFGSSRALDALDAAVRANPGALVLVDLSNVTFLDSTALIAFAKARSTAAARGGVVRLQGANAFATRMLEIWHLESTSSPAQDPDDPRPGADVGQLSGGG